MSIIESKAAKMLCTGRVRVVECGCGRPARVRVEGDHDTYVIVVDATGASCPCPARLARCSHAVAAELIVGEPA